MNIGKFCDTAEPTLQKINGFGQENIMEELIPMINKLE